MTTSSLEATALSVAEQLTPILVAGLNAAAAAGAPQAALLAMAAEVIPPMIQSFGATSGQIAQIMAPLIQNIKVGQAGIDQAAQARGIPVETPA